MDKVGLRKTLKSMPHSHHFMTQATMDWTEADVGRRMAYVSHGEDMVRIARIVSIPSNPGSIVTTDLTNLCGVSGVSADKLRDMGTGVLYMSRDNERAPGEKLDMPGDFYFLDNVA